MATQRPRNVTTDPALIVFGTSSHADKPQAGWFREAYAGRARSAAQRHGLSTITINTDQARAAAAGLAEGKLQVGGRITMPVVGEEVVQHLRTLLPIEPITSETIARTDPEASPTVTSAAPVTSAAWDALTVGTVVLSPYFGKRNELEGWWEATIVDIKGEKFFLSWRDEPELGVFQRLRHHIALLPPKV